MSVFDLYANAVLNGLMIGAIYALIATGLNIIFGVMRVVNFAHGEMVVIGMYIGFAVWKFSGLPPLAAVPIATLVMFMAGYLFQRAIGNDFVDQPQHIQFVFYIGLGLTITGLHAVIFGPDPRGIQDAMSFVSYRIGLFRVDASRLNAAAAALIIIFGLWAWLRYSLTGKSLHAAGENLTGGKVIGIRISHVFALTAAIGMACAGTAGALIAPLYDVTPYLAYEFTLTAFIIVIVGGLASLPGALVGGLLIGVSEALAAAIVSPSAKSFISYSLLIVMLLIKPDGLFSPRRTSR
jgi:branched-chain amino acid transport system permease protein